jgi:amino acid transporter
MQQFYVVSLALVGLLVPYNHPQLLNGSSSADAKASPFVIAIRNAGISGLPSVMNAVIMVAVLSVGNSSVYGSSRTLAALADQGQAPKILSYVDRKGRPMVGIIIASLIGALAYFAASNQRTETEAFTWMLALSGLSSIFTCGSICLSHIRFRKAWRVQGHTLDELAFRSQPGVIGSWIGLAMNCIVLVAQFWTGFAPVGYAHMSAKSRVRNFFEAYLAAPIVIICYIGYKIWYRTPFIRSKDMDLHTGIRELNLGAMLAEERAEKAAWPAWRKVYKFFC